MFMRVLRSLLGGYWRWIPTHQRGQDAGKEEIEMSHIPDDRIFPLGICQHLTCCRFCSVTSMVQQLFEDEVSDRLGGLTVSHRDLAPLLLKYYGTKDHVFALHHLVLSPIYDVRCIVIKERRYLSIPTRRRPDCISQEDIWSIIPPYNTLGGAHSKLLRRADNFCSCT